MLFVKMNMLLSLRITCYMFEFFDLLMHNVGLLEFQALLRMPRAQNQLANF